MKRPTSPSLSCAATFTVALVTQGGGKEFLFPFFRFLFLFWFSRKTRRSMFFDPKNKQIHVFRPEKRADPCFSTRKTRKSMFFDQKNAQIHVIRPGKRADPCFSTRKTRKSMFFDQTKAQIHVFRPEKRANPYFSTRKKRANPCFSIRKTREAIEPEKGKKEEWPEPWNVKLDSSL